MYVDIRTSGVVLRKLNSNLTLFSKILHEKHLVFVFLKIEHDLYKYYLMDSGVWREPIFITTPVGTITENRVELKNLRNYTNYTIKVSVVDERGKMYLPKRFFLETVIGRKFRFKGIFFLFWIGLELKRFDFSSTGFVRFEKYRRSRIECEKFI